jgi:hypothetical protein
MAMTAAAVVATAATAAGADKPYDGADGRLAYDAGVALRTAAAGIHAAIATHPKFFNEKKPPYQTDEQYERARTTMYSDEAEAKNRRPLWLSTTHHVLLGIAGRIASLIAPMDMPAAALTADPTGAKQALIAVRDHMLAPARSLLREGSPALITEREYVAGFLIPPLVVVEALLGQLEAASVPPPGLRGRTGLVWLWDEMARGGRGADTISPTVAATTTATPAATAATAAGADKPYDGANGRLAYNAGVALRTAVVGIRAALSSHPAFFNDKKPAYQEDEQYERARTTMYSDAAEAKNRRPLWLNTTHLVLRRIASRIDSLIAPMDMPAAAILDDPTGAQQALLSVRDSMLAPAQSLLQEGSPTLITEREYVAGFIIPRLVIVEALLVQLAASAPPPGLRGRTGLACLWAGMALGRRVTDHTQSCISALASEDLSDVARKGIRDILLAIQALDAVLRVMDTSRPETQHTVFQTDAAMQNVLFSLVDRTGLTPREFVETYRAGVMPTFTEFADPAYPLAMLVSIASWESEVEVGGMFI